MINQKDIKIITLLSLFILICTVNGFAQQNFKFPKFIKYALVNNGRVGGNVIYTCNNLGKKLGYMLILNNFEGFGHKSNDEWYTFLKPNLKLERSFISKGKYNKKKQNTFNELYLKKEISFFGNKNEKGINEDMVYIFKENKYSGPQLTEIASPYDIIDLLSSFVILSKRVANDRYDNKNNNIEWFNLFISSTSYLVYMEYSDEKEILNIGGKQYNTKVMTLKYNIKLDKTKTGKESKTIDLFTFYIYNETGGLCYPVKVKFEDVESNILEFIAKKAF